MEIPYSLGAPQYPMPEIQHFIKFRLNAGLDKKSANQIWQKLKCWPDGNNIHDLFTVMPVPV